MKKRIITPRREILAKDVNDLNDFIEDNFIVYSRDILGVSDGIAQGLTLDSFTDLDITIDAGVAFSNGKFYELLTNTTLTLPSVDGVYKVYALKSSTSDLPISGYVLLDTSTRQETYDAVNSRTYDSLTLGYTLGSVPSNAFLLGEATVSGSIITAYDDQRTLTSIGNLASNSIQAFSETARNYGTSENEITGFIFDQTDVYKPFVKVTIDNSFEGKAIVIDNGTNAGSQGIYNLVRGNIGTYTAFSGSDGIGSYSELSNNNIGFATNSATSGTTIGFRATNADVGFKSVNSTVGLKIESDSSSVSGIQIVGSNSGLDKGIEITDTYEGIVLENNNHNDIKITRDNVGGAVVSSASIVLGLTNNDSDSTIRTVSGIGMDLSGKNLIGQLIKFHPMASDSFMIGYAVEGGSSSNLATIGFSAIDLRKGIYLEDNAVGINILPKVDQQGIVIDGAGNNGSLGILIEEVKEPIRIANRSTATVVPLLDIQGDSSNLTNTSYGLGITRTNNALFIFDNNVGININNIRKKGIVIDANYNNTEAQKGIEINLSNNNSNINFNEAIRLNISGSNKYGQNIAITPTDSSSPIFGQFISSNSATNNVVGIGIQSVGKGLVITNSQYPIQITSSSSTTANIDIAGSGTSNSDIGIQLNSFKEAIKITSSRRGYVFSNTTLLSPSSSSDQTIGSQITLSGGNTTTAYPNIGQKIALNGNNKVGQYVDLNTTSAGQISIGSYITNTDATAESSATIGQLIAGKSSSYKIGAGVSVVNATRGIDLSGGGVDFPFRVSYLEGSDPLPSSPSNGDIVFRLIGGTTFDIYMYDSTLLDWRKNNGQDT